MAHCPRCGKVNPDDFGYCVYCGVQLREVSELEQEAILAWEEDVLDPEERAAQEPAELPPVADICAKESIRSFYKNYACFRGRATKKEFLSAWLPFLYLHFGLLTLVFIVFGVLMFFPMAKTGWLMYFAGSISLIEYIYWLGHFVPMLALSCRRMHDQGKSGWTLLWLAFVPLGTLYVLFRLLGASDGDNKYGPRRTAAVLAAEKEAETK